jgi:hypothetical protein
VSKAASVSETEAITDVGARLGWTVVSMARDWTSVFAPVRSLEVTSALLASTSTFE